MKLLGLDIGTNSVGSAWVDTEACTITMGVSVFPAGVEESDTKRGVPKNQARRASRSQRRSIERRADRKHRMRRFLLAHGWMPTDSRELKDWLDNLNPWMLRAAGIERELKPHEFGRVLLHIAQRRGAHGVDIENEEPSSDKAKAERTDDVKAREQEKIRAAIKQTHEAMKTCGAQTFGQLMAFKFEERRKSVGNNKSEIYLRIRNRKDAAGDDVYEFCADRQLIWEEFDRIWTKQRSFGGALAPQLTDACRKELDSATGDQTWRCQGILFGQRRTYWNFGTLGRCDLEPTDMRCPRVDMYAQEFLVLETVNNIRIMAPGEMRRPLTVQQRQAVIKKLESQKTASMATVRAALELHKGLKKTQYTLSLEADPERGLNTNWFQREIVKEAIGLEEWQMMPPETRESVNQAILKFDPESAQDRQTLRRGCHSWWNLDEKRADRLVETWMKRPKTDNRVNYSRRAILNLLPYMREGLTVNGARKAFVEDATNGATDEQRQRYGFQGSRANRAMRRYLEKHPDLLPPAPAMLSNPVVRKAIYEVRDHIQAYIRRFGGKPGRIVIELARDAYLPAKIRNQQLSDNRRREQIRTRIIDDYHLGRMSKTQQDKAVKRVLLCQEQRAQCAYCGNGNNTISDKAAAEGDGVELDHIIPESRGGDSGLNNLVLCHMACNRGKGNKTPREWLGEEQFGALEPRLRHLRDDNPAKWNNLHKEVKDLDGFVESQLTDTAYAAKQVAEWLRAILYDGESDSVRHVFTTKGRYTAWLRRDWGLFPDRETDNPGRDQVDSSLALQAENATKEKDRSDHRQHAVDAVAIALTSPERLKELALAVEQWELAKATGRAAPRREPVKTPWGDFDSFRCQVMEEREHIIVSHRPERRRLAGELHKAEHFGALANDRKHFTKRIFAVELSVNHLRVPQGWEELRRRLEAANTKAQRTCIRRQMLALEDVEPAKSGIVRDRWFREELRACLRRNGLDPDQFSKDKGALKKYKEWIKTDGKGLVLPSGVPVRRIVLLRTLGNPVEVRRRRYNFLLGKMEQDLDSQDRRSERRRLRVYESQNNHHIEIREDSCGKWVGKVVTNYEAARRVRPSKVSGEEPRPAVDRRDNGQGRFVMSLSIGETIYMSHPSTNKVGYFVVFKIDPTKEIHFTSHCDAGRAKASEREDISLSPADLQKQGVPPEREPQKVWVGPLSDVKVLRRD
jgi:CRISPR-associated endonuclease Csn1